MFNLFHKTTLHSIDARRFPHIFGELYNNPIALDENELFELENDLVNAAVRGETNGEYTMSNIPLPYTYGSLGIIPISGIIMSSCSPEEMSCGMIGCDQIKSWLDEALNDNSINGIIFSVDSNGGSINGVHSLAEYIADKRIQKPMVAYANDCCSAAYWLVASLPINVNLTSNVGGIGVTFCTRDTSKYYREQGIEITQFKSAKFKGQGADGVPIVDEYKEKLNKKTMQIGSLFTNHVLKYKKLTDTEQALDGSSYLGEESISLGLAQGLVKSIDDLLTTFGD